MTIKNLVVAMAGMAMLSLAAGVSAQPGTDQQGSSGSYGGSAGSQGSQGSAGSQDSMGQAGSQGATGMMGQQLEGRVLKADSKSITIEYMGTAIPLEVRKNTLFQGVKSAKDVKEGQQVRASFELKGNKNELTSVEVISSGAGSSSSTKKQNQ